METGHEAPAGDELGRPVLFWEEAGAEWRCRESPGHGANPDEIALYRVGREGAEEIVADTAVASDSVIDAVEAAWRGDAGVRLLYADLDAASMAADYGFGPLAADADPWVSRRCALVEPDGGDAFYVDVADPTDLYVSARDLLEEAGRLCGPDGTQGFPWMGFRAGAGMGDVARALAEAFSPSADDPRGVEAAELLRDADLGAGLLGDAVALQELRHVVGDELGCVELLGGDGVLGRAGLRHHVHGRRGGVGVRHGERGVGADGQRACERERDHQGGTLPAAFSPPSVGRACLGAPAGAAQRAGELVARGRPTVLGHFGIYLHACPRARRVGEQPMERLRTCGIGRVFTY